MRVLMLTVAVMFCFSGSIHAEWLNFNAGCSDGTEPVINHGRTTDNYMTFDVELRGLDSESIQHDLETYSRFINTPGVRMLSDSGIRELPLLMSIRFSILLQRTVFEYGVTLVYSLNSANQLQS